MEQNYKRQIKDYSKKPKIFDDKNNQNLNNWWFLFKKTEKLTTAIYMITDFYDDRESLKWELRTVATSFLSFITSFLRLRSLYSKNTYLVNVGGFISNITSLLEVSYETGFMSTMNFSILRNEFYTLGELMKTQLTNDNFMEEFTFPENFFKFPEKNYNKIDPVRGREGPQRASVSNGVENYKKYKGRRREEILQLLKIKGEVTIKDISTAILDISEKTIQRELISLIQEDIVERKGERRWSTYVLKNFDS